jgi:lipopolysaccharide biosynthesis regulator YciM
MNPIIYYVIVIAAVIVVILLFASLQFRSRKKRPSPSPYTEALNYLIDGNITLAAQKLREAAQKDSSNVDAFLRLGNIYRDTGNVQRAIKIHTELTLRTELTPTMRMDVYRVLALDYTAAGNIVRALEYIDTLLHHNKRDRWALQQKQSLLEQRGDFRGAFDQEKRIQNLDGTSNSHKLALIRSQEGIALFRQGKGRDARLRFREAIKIQAGCAPAYLFWGESYLNEDRVQDAVNIWAKFVKANPADAYLAFQSMESVLFDMGRFGEMEAYYRQVLEQRPGDVHALVALAKFLHKKGESESALRVLKDGLDRNPDSLWIRRNMILIHAHLKDTDSVLALAHDILERVMSEEYHFKCQHCGNITTEPTWFCPKCRTWDSYDL